MGRIEDTFYIPRKEEINKDFELSELGKYKAAEECLVDLGYTVVNPARVNAQLPEDTTHEEYMKTSIAMLDMCDIIFLMDG